MPQSIPDIDRSDPARERPSRRAALGFSLAAVFLLYYAVGIVLELLSGRWESRDLALHIAFGVYVVVVTLCVNWRAVRTLRRRRSGRSKSNDVLPING
ncbi:MAG TPA: hypothetical protein VID48_00885 [Solirubrobacteraceae bacterium]|jgi:uncharacterized membrane-anchored protein